jgi:hypothetical protein
MWSFHQLETASAFRINPARVVRNVLRQHSAVPAETLSYWSRILLLETLNHHEQHD